MNSFSIKDIKHKQRIVPEYTSRGNTRCSLVLPETKKGDKVQITVSTVKGKNGKAKIIETYTYSPDTDAKDNKKIALAMEIFFHESN